MKTTVDLPDDVFRKAREQAEQQGIDVERFISRAIIKAVAAETPPRAGRVTLPLIKSKGKGPLKVPDNIMGTLETQEDIAKHAASLRR